MAKNNQILTEVSYRGNKVFKVFEKDEKSNGFISLTMEIENPDNVKLNMSTYSYGTTEAEFNIFFDHDIETLEKLVEWTKNVTRKANRQIKKLKEQG